MKLASIKLPKAKSVTRSAQRKDRVGGPADPQRAFLLDEEPGAQGGVPHLSALSQPSTVRIVTYNIHSCVGLDRRYDPARVAAVLREIGAGIACLQEVGFRRRGDPILDQAAYLAEATGCSVLCGTGLRDHSRRFRNAILTRFPVLALGAIDLGIPGCEPRGAIDADLLIDGRVVRVIATHFGLRREERHLQSNRVIAALSAPLPPGRQPAATVLVMGDLNEWRGRKGGIRALEGRLGPSVAPRTFPSFMPLLALDRIYVDAHTDLQAVEVYRSPLARVASDHLPVVGTLSWGEPSEAALPPLRREKRAAARLAAASRARVLAALSHQQKRRATPIG
jgi:endonuclease/exonuclease/phosphatase family metal-dependent hydrolase